MATQEIGMPVQRPAAARAAPPRAGSAETPSTPALRAAVQWTLAPCVLPLTAAVALGVHHWMPNHQSPEPTKLYPRLLVVLIGLGIFIGLTQRLWRPSKLTLRSFPWAW